MLLFGDSQYRKVKQKKAVTMTGVEKKAKENKLRSVLDMPVTDPGQDFVYSSTEEEFEGEDGIRVFRNAGFRKSHAVATDTVDVKMPPELIITSTKVLMFRFQEIEAFVVS